MKKIILLFVIMGLAMLQSLGQSTANYAYSTVTNGSLIDMSSGTTDIFATGTYRDDNASALFDFGFTFYFMGTPYSQFSINSNGQMRLGATVIGGTQQSPTASTPLIVPISGDNALRATGKAHFKVNGSAPNRVLIVEWVDIRIPYGSSVETGTYCTFQALLYEGTGKIEFIYGRMYNMGTSASSRSVYFSIGATAGQIGEMRTITVTPTYTANQASLSSTSFALSSDMTNLNSVADGSRRVFTFTPPAAPIAPTWQAATIVTPISMQINWLDNSSNETGFHIYRSTDGISYTYIATTAANATSYLASGLISATTYYWQVFAINEGALSEAASGSQATSTAVPLVGGSTYPINNVNNPPVEFSNITNAVAYLTTDGVTGTGQVIFELGNSYSSATETGPINIPAIPGASATLGVTFRPAAGVTALTSIAGAASPNQHAILITGSYITLDGRAGGAGSGRDWTVSVTGTTDAQMAVRLNNSGASMTALTIRNLIMEGAASSTTGAVFQITGGSTYTMTNVIVENNLIKSLGAISPSVRGYGITVAVASNTGNTGLIVRNNEIVNVYARGINLTGGFPGMEVYENVIYHNTSVTQPTTTEFAGIYFSTSSSPGAKIHSNYLHSIQLTNGTTSITGIQTLVANTSGNPVVIYNNRIDLGIGVTVMTVPIYGIHYSSSTNTYLFDFFFNSVRIGGTATSGSSNSAAFRKAGGTAINVSNNIFYNNRTNSVGTGTHWAIAVNATTFGSIGNNDYFTDGTGGVLGTTDNTTAQNKITLDAWKAAVPSDNASVSQNPNFIAGLEIDATIPTQLESGGVPIAGITTDFQGNARNVTSPDIGADEFAGSGLDLTPPTIAYTALLNTASTAARTIVVNLTDLSGVPITAPGWPYLYWKKTGDAGYTGVAPISVSAPDYTFSFGAGVGVGDVVEYYVVAQDNALTPNVGAFPLAGADGFTPNPPAAATPPTTPSSYTIIAGIGGALTVGTGGDYPTLTGAGGLFADINTKIVTGNITATILSDLTELGTNALNQWNEDAPGNFTLTIQPSEAVNKTISGTYAGGLIRLNGADRVTFDGRFGGSGNYLTIQNTSTATSTAAIQLLSLGAGVGATDNTIRNCNIAAGSNTVTSTFGIFVGGATVSTSGTGAHNNNLTVVNNEISKAYYGIYARGVASTGLLTGLEISDNNIGSSVSSDYVLYRGVDIQNATAPIVTDNTIFNLKLVTSVNNVAIDLGANVTDAVVSANKIHGIHSTSTSGYGAYGINISATTTSNITIANNVIYDLITDGDGTSTTFNPFGIRITGGTNHKVYFNSVNLYGSFTNITTVDVSAAIIITSSTTTGLDVRNNIFSNSMTGGAGTKCFAIHVATGTTFGTINYNDYYVSGAQGVLGYLTTDKTILADWQAATTQDANSISVDPQFVSETNLQPFTGSLVISAGTPIVGITTDYTGAVRSGTTPSIGAYENGQAAAAVGWANLQWPPTANITEGQTFDAYARVWQDGVTPGAGQGPGIESWFGWNATNTDPATWTNWIAGSYNTDNGNDDEYMAAIGAGITSGTYYYASRFRTTGGTYQYGGYSAGGGNFWDGITYVSGVLTVNPYTVTSLPWYESYETQWPPIGWSNSNWDNSLYGAARTGTKWAYSNTTGSLLTTAGVVIPASGTYQFSFWYRVESASYAQSMNVFLSTNGVDFTVPVATIVGAINTTYVQVVYDLSAYNGQTVYFRFNGTSGTGGFDWGICVDDVEVKPSATTWLGTTNTAWGTGTNWSNGVPVSAQDAVIGVSANNPSLNTAAAVNNLTINNGAVLNVTNGGQLTVNGALTNSAGNAGLVLQSTAAGTGSLVHNTADVPATIQRYITGDQYHFASVPLTAAANPTADLFLHSYLWKYDPTIPNWVKYLNEADALTVTQGYMIWYTGATTTYNFVGNMNTGAFTAATPGGAGTFNLVPNPYPSAIDWTAATGWTKTNIANATYIYNNDQYASYVLGVGTNGGTNIIPVGQAFFVEATGAATLAMNNSVRTHSSQAYFNDPVINDLFRIAVAINGKSDETVVRFTESATPSFDSEYDAAKLYGSSSAPQLYTMTADNEMLSINSQSMTEGGVSVPLSFEFSADGEITLQFSGLGSFSELQAIFIEDLLTGSMTDLRQHASYTFSHLVSNEPDRFLLHFRDITGLDESGTAWQVWSNNRKVYVNIPELNGQRVSIEMFDVLGSRLFSSEGVLNSPAVVHAMKSGVAIVRVSSADRVYTTKIFIQ